MQLKYMKATIALFWILAVCGAGFLADLTSPSAWTFLVGFALLPPLVMMRYWKDPAQSMSESIQKALR
jgi:hypothetical protein